MDRKRIFVVDDDLSILRLIAVNLECRGYQATTFNSGAQVLAQLKRAEPDLMILDLLLPEVDGIELVRLTRKVSRVPILVVSARAEVTSKLKALELGADNYLTKPFGVDELIARVRAILRRFAAAPASMVAWTYHCGDLDVDLDKSEVVLSGRRVKLSPNPPMDGARTGEGGKGVTGAMIRARIRVDGRLAGGLQALLGAPMSACSGCGERDGRIGHGKRRSRTGMA